MWLIGKINLNKNETKNITLTAFMPYNEKKVSTTYHQYHSQQSLRYFQLKECFPKKNIIFSKLLIKSSEIDLKKVEINPKIKSIYNNEIKITKSNFKPNLNEAIIIKLNNQFSIKKENQKIEKWKNKNSLTTLVPPKKITINDADLTKVLNDQNNKTSWSSASGRKPIISITPQEPSLISSVGILLGNQYTFDQFPNTNRIKNIKLRINNIYIQNIQLKDAYANNSPSKLENYFTIPIEYDKKINAIDLIITKQYSGDLLDELSISEVALFHTTKVR